MRFVKEMKEAEVSNYYGEHGHSTVDIVCPFCNTMTRAYVWSIRGGGKMCDGCDTMLTSSGNAELLYPVLTQAQIDILIDLVQFKMANIGDGWYPNSRSLKALKKKGLITYGGWRPQGVLMGIGWFPTEDGEAYSKVLKARKVSLESRL